MLIEAMGQIIDPAQVSDWGKIIQSDEFRLRLLQSKLRIGKKVKGQQIYYIAYGHDEYELFSFLDNDKSKPVVYYCKIRSNTARNSMFKPNIGFSTSAVWRIPRHSILPPGFALAVYDEFISEKLVERCIISDIQQTLYGVRAWQYTAELLTNKGWKLYACLNAPSDASCVIPLTIDQLDKHIDDLFNRSSAYAFRCCVLLKPNQKIKNIINNPSKTLFLSYDDAVDLNAFKAPVDLLDKEEILLEEEINRPKKY